MKRIILALLIIPFIFSCFKKDVDVRDQYVGTWKYNVTGGINTYNGSQILESFPLINDGSLTIAKSGENGLLIDKKEFTLQGDQLTTDPDQIELISPGQAFIIATAKIISGKVTATKITHTSSLTGTWTFGNSRGPLSGELLVTLTR
jgi:hypothetical protein